MEYLSSMYLDDELNLDEKQRFVENIHLDTLFYRLTLDLLDQERLIRKAEFKKGRWERSDFRKWIRPFGVAMAGLVMVVMFYVFPSQTPQVFHNRFVLFQPEASQVEMAGSFTGWQKIPLKQIGESGYWELTLPLPSGEYRFAYILNGDQKIPDPTCLFREQDDFGGENSILTLGT